MEPLDTAVIPAVVLWPEPIPMDETIPVPRIVLPRDLALEDTMPLTRIILPWDVSKVATHKMKSVHPNNKMRQDSTLPLIAIFVVLIILNAVLMTIITVVSSR